MSENQGKRLAEMIARRDAPEKAEKDRRKDHKELIETYDLDIARLVDAINSGQSELFEEEEAHA